MKHYLEVLSHAVKLLTTAFAALTLIGCVNIDPYEENEDRNDVITVGDSIFDLNGEIQEELERRAGETFRDYTQSGAQLASGFFGTPFGITSVTDQYSDARDANPNINTIVMDGGGNDVLIPASLGDPYGCRTHWWRWRPWSSCFSLIRRQYRNAVDLLNRMDRDGVDDVVWLGYYELPRSNANLTQALNAGNSWLKSACSNTSASCTFVDPRGTVPASQVIDDDVHPTIEGSRNLAGQIWPVLEPLL